MYRQSSVKSDNKITLHFISQNVPLARGANKRPMLLSLLLLFHFSNAVNRLINCIFQKNKCWGQDLNHQPSDLIHDELIRPQDHGVLLTSFTCLFLVISLHKINRPALYPAGQTDMQTYLHNTHTLSALCSLQLTLPTHPPQHNWIMSNLEWLPMPCNCALFGGPLFCVDNSTPQIWIILFG